MIGICPDVVIDPTMCLSNEEWRQIENKPFVSIPSKYILVYFLGELTKEQLQQLDVLKRKYDLDIVNLCDEKYYNSIGPAEFLYLIDNAEVMITDSFHGSVFSIIFDTALCILDRVDNYITMNSRIETLVEKFELKNCRMSNLCEIKFEHDYSVAHKKLVEERIKFRNYIELCMAE